MKTRLMLAVVGALAPAALAQDGPYRATPIPADAPRPIILAFPGDGPGYDLNWNTIDGGGGPLIGAFGYNLNGTVGQPDAGLMSGGGYEMGGGYWNLPDETSCYANCDGSNTAPILTANDFQCFLDAFAAASPYANCDGSSVHPVLNANDFQCFLNSFAAGCS